MVQPVEPFRARKHQGMLGDCQYARRGKMVRNGIYKRQRQRARRCLQQGYTRAVIDIYAPSMQLPRHPHGQFAIGRDESDALSGNLQCAPDAHRDGLCLLGAIVGFQPFDMWQAFAGRRQLLPIYAMFRQAEYL